MVLYRKGRMVKIEQIEKALKRANNIREAYEILEQFNLTNAEECKIAQSWQKEQMMLKVHGQGVYCQKVEA
jgi:hypothetical protein